MIENGVRPRSIVAGRERWEVDALRGQPELAMLVETLLADEHAICAVSVNPQTGRLLVLYDARARESAAEPVRDAVRSGLERVQQVVSADAPRRPAVPQLTLRSSVPGRQRWEISGLRGAQEFAGRLTQGLLAVDGISAVAANPLTGRLLVHHDPSLSPPAVGELLRTTVAKVRSDGSPPVVEDRASVLGVGDQRRGSGSPQAFVLGSASLAVGLALGGAFVASSLVVGVGALVVTGLVVRSSLRRSRWDPADPESGLERGGRGHPLQRVLRLLGKERRRFYVALGLSVATKVLDVTPPLLLGFAVTILIRGGSPALASRGLTTMMSQIWFLAGLGVAIWTLESACQYGASRTWRDLGQTLQHQLRIDTYTHVQRLPMEYFEDQRTGELASILSDDINQLQQFVNNRAAELAEVVTNLVIVAPIFYLLSPSLAWVAVIPIPLIVWWSFWYEDHTAPYYSATREAAGLLSSQVVNNFDGIATTKSFTAEEYEVERLRTLSDAYRRSNARPNMLASAFTPLVRMAVLLGFAGTIVVGGRQVVRGSLGAGRYTSMISLTQRFVWPLTTLGYLVDDYQRAMAALARVLDARDLPLGSAGGERPLLASSVTGDIVLEHVSFAYRSHEPALRDITIHLQAGETVGIVGPTGAGKTTLLKLLLRFYDLDAGRIVLDGVDIREFQLRDLRDAIGFMSQDIFLFYGTVRENIAYGSFEAGEEAVVRAARLAEADGFIRSLPQGYDTVIGDRGVKLSGGQRQRVSLARVVLKDAPILLLDEATASLDNETDVAIQRALQRFAKGRTTVAIAHRISTVRSADCIYVLGRDGTIVERGQHDELVRLNGVYNTLWRFESEGAMLSDRVFGQNE